MAKAATGLALTPPAISKVIGDTEILPGVSLLDRTPHGVVTPTLYGDSALRARVIDVFVTRLNMEPEEDIQSEALFYDPLVVVTGRDTPRFRGRSVKLAQLMNEA